MDDLNNATEEEQLAVVKEEGWSIDYIKKPSEVVQLAAVSRVSTGWTIKYVKNPSEVVQLAAVKQDPSNIRYIDNPYQAVKDFLLVMETMIE